MVLDQLQSVEHGCGIPRPACRLRHRDAMAIADLIDEVGDEDDRRSPAEFAHHPTLVS